MRKMWDSINRIYPSRDDKVMLATAWIFALVGVISFVAALTRR